MLNAESTMIGYRRTHWKGSRRRSVVGVVVGILSGGLDCFHTAVCRSLVYDLLMMLCLFCLAHKYIRFLGNNWSTCKPVRISNDVVRYREYTWRMTFDFHYTWAAAGTLLCNVPFEQMAIGNLLQLVIKWISNENILLARILAES